MKAIVQTLRDTGTETFSRRNGEVTWSVHGRGKAAVVAVQLPRTSAPSGRIVEFELKELQAALKGLELASR